MATATKPITMKITNAGKLSGLNPDKDAAKILINLTRLGIGSSKYAVTGKETKLKTLIKSVDTVSGDTDASTNTLRFNATVHADNVTPVYEMGLFNDKGVLFAVASSTGAPLFTVYPNVAFVIAFGISLNDAALNTVTVMLGENSAISKTLMQNHVKAENPHPQYLGKNHLDVSADPHPQYLTLSRFQFFVDTLFPIGYLHYTHSTTNPKPEFDEILGVSTAWRRLLGKVVVATDPNDPYIKTAGVALGQKGMTTAAGTDRPHAYPLYATNVFERYNPADVIETVWQVNADKVSINEGASVRFTVSANNLPDGQILTWAIKEGVLSSSSNSITTVDKSTSGTVILKNGRAVIDFTTTPDENNEEPQKHVRLTVGAPANLSINVPINDAGSNETVVHITKSTTDGLQLDEYYKQQSGSYPTSKDKVRFIVNAGVDVIAPDTDTPALIDGYNWPDGSQIIVENRGRILGRGGDGGEGAVLIRAARYTSKLFYTEPASKGGDGGTAVKSITKPILIENYNVIAGGGGGGGGGGAYVYDFNSTDRRMGHQNGTAAGGGAPLGRASINAGSAEWYMADSRNPDVNFIKANIDINDTTTFYALTYSGTSVADAKLTKHGLYFRHTETFENSPRLRSDFKDVPLWIPAMRAAIDNGALYSRFKSQIDADTSGRIFFQKVWPDAENEVKNMSIICKRATDATIAQAGLGGYSVGAYTDKSNLYQSDDGGDLSVNSGGNGGALGEAGKTFVLSNYLILDNVNDTNNLAPKSLDKTGLTVSRRHELAPASGGLAGYIKEGSVTINNYASGTAKGR